MIEVVNLTPDAINIADETGKVIATFPPSGMVARRRVRETEVDPLHLTSAGRPIPVISSRLGVVEGLPGPRPDTIYLVSAMVLSAPSLHYCRDVYAPDTGPASVVRDAAGQIIAVKRLIAAHKD